jgi:hypothetical protein
MCSWGWGLFSESITNHPQTSGIFGRSEAVSIMLIFHREQYHLPSSCISNFRMSLSVEAWVCEFQMSFVLAFKIHIVWGEGTVTADWHRNGWGKPGWIRSPDFNEISILLYAGLSPVRPYFKVISQVLVHWLLPVSFERCKGRKIKFTWQKRKRSWELECFCDLDLAQSRLAGYSP